MRILMIGGTGFSGPYVVQNLANLGHEVTLFHRSRTEANLPEDVQHILGDREHLTSFTDSLRQFRPQIVVDMIPRTARQARAVMDVFAGSAQRVIAISSQDVYRAYGKLIGVEQGPLEALPLTEASPLRQKLYPYREQVDADHPLYDYDKILAERVFMGNPELPGTILRFPMVYGPGDYQHRLFSYLKRMDDKRPAILLEAGMANWRWTKGYVENVATAVSLAITNERAIGRIYNVGETNTLTETAWVKAIGAAAGWQGEIVTISKDNLPEQMVPDINTDQHLVVDSTRIREELGYTEPILLDEALRRTVNWERVHPPQEIDPKQFDYAAEDVLLRKS